MSFKNFIFFMATLFSVNLFAEKLVYEHGGVQLEGYLALPKLLKKQNPGVLIVHDWMGLSEYTEKKAQEMAEKGFIALAVDVYGQGVKPKDAKEAGALAGKYKSDRNLFRERLKAAFETLKKQKNLDEKNIIVFGYCFGGTAALELARSGASVAGVVSFHGGLDNPRPQDAKNIKGKVLILHGAIDPYVPAKDVEAFQKEMNEASVDYQLIAYSGAVHAFTNPKAGSDIKAGAAYNAIADKRSWIAFEAFLKEVVK